MRSTYFGLEKCPAFDPIAKPFILLSDDRFISLVNIVTKTVVKVLKS
jgi:hypothetical protein